jgi:cytochrome c oxidase subunit 3
MAQETAEGHQTYYVPESSKLPFLASIGLLLTVYGAGTMLNSATFGYGGSSWAFYLGLLVLLAAIWSWFGNTIRESLAGLNSPQLDRSYVLGMQWFIFSEIMFFAAFFGALFYVRTFAVPWLGGEGDKGIANMLWPGFEAAWPLMTTPQQAVEATGGVQAMARTDEFTGANATIHWNSIPLLNTILLLTSSVTVHFAHTALKAGKRQALTWWLAATLLLGFTFVGFQAYEYVHAYRDLGLTLGAGIYGATFFLLTGFHGVHVCLGAIMLTVMFVRATRHGHFTPEHHFGFEAASWYWHFVDVVWVCLFLFVYIL